MNSHIVIPVLISFAISLILGPVVIPFLRKLKMGQTERVEGVQSHLKKAGTPTMGGVIILASVAVTSLIYVKDYPQIIPVLFLTVGFGLIGFLDDYLKVVMKRSDGLYPMQKMALQIVVTAIFAYYLVKVAKVPLTMIVPFTHGYELNLGWLAIPVLFFAVIGTVNGTNFTDGLDGLASSVTVLVATFFTVVAVGTKSGLEPITCAVVGALMGFLLFNVYPASVFMGDTGSLALGGFVAGTAYMMRMPLFILIVGFIYLAEVISVILQVTYFKKTGGKRLFKMAPIHHHFVLCGWSETRVVDVFSIIKAILCVNEMRDRGIPIWGEIELAYEAGKGEVLAITGTNGKTTTTSLLGQIMKNYTENTYVVGNIGNPYTSVALETTEDSVIVAEMSSFQLETIETFRPRVSAILNITPDHLNRHHTMEAYIAAKENIAKNQTEEDTCVLNYEDAVTRQFGETLKAKVLYFSSQRILEEGIYLDGEKIVLSLNGEKTEICTVNELNILGTHNHENAMAAAAMAAAYGVPVEIIRKTLKEFQGVEHRIEFVAEKDGVVYYNDSKGTNPDAAIKGIQAMNRPTVLIGGGYDKDSAYDEWINAFDGKVKKLVLIGATREKIAQTAEKLGFHEIVMADTFEEAFEKCVEYAEPGDAVLLSPACASWGMFKNYEQRGDKFKELVNQL